ncbi:MAG: filamentous hemagglutinin N-terminal domain-containing protein, partial [Alphaproteobacteria bacterium]|nr:filamentous hemagglutinin N-terminal domain-containing protein [Alphaproteobacteria bacterium]
MTLALKPHTDISHGSRLKQHLLARSALSGLPLLGVSLAALAGVTLSPLPARALPQDGQVVAGAASIARTSTASMAINQSTMAAVIDWQSFDIGANETVEVFQPSSMASLLNRVVGGGGASQILGTLQAQGRLTLVNPAGITIGNSARVDVAGLVASTADMSNQDFMHGRGNFSIAGRPGARIVNAGEISVRDGGLAALVAPGVENSGTIAARLGRVQLAAGETFTLDMYGDDLIHVGVSDTMLASMVNSGRISADGGVIEITARSGAAAVDSLINMGGVVEARSVGMENGTVVFYGASDGVVQLTGKVDVSGRSVGETGGTIKVLGGKVALAGNASLDASGDAGGGTILVGGDFQGKGETPTARRTYVGRDVTINADAITTGNADKVIVWADGDTRYYGSISARGGVQSGDGGLVEVSGKRNLGFDGKVDTSAANGAGGSLLLDPEFIVIENSPSPTSPASADDGEISGDGTIFFSDPDGPLGLTFFISENALEGLSTATITLQATNSITINNLDDDELTLNQSGLVKFEAGAGGFEMLDPNDFIHFTSTGSLTISTFGDSGSVALGDITVGKIGLGPGNLTLTGTKVTLNGDVSTMSGGINITASDVEFFGALNAGAGAVTITNTSPTLQVGDNPGSDMKISRAELAKITAGTLTLTSPGVTTVDGILPDDSAGIGDLVIQSDGGDINFSGGASSFNLLTVKSPAEIKISTNLTVTGLGPEGEGSPSLFLLADTDADGIGALTVDTGALVETTKHGAFMQIRAADLDIESGFLKVPVTFGGIGVNIQKDGNSIGIGTAAGNMTISNEELTRMTGVQFDVIGDGASHTTTVS